jgi:hypothetical protein
MLHIVQSLSVASLPTIRFDSKRAQRLVVGGFRFDVINDQDVSGALGFFQF